MECKRTQEFYEVNFEMLEEDPNDDPSDVYPIIDSHNLGYLLIFNQTKNRPGTDNDVRRLKESFEKRGFLVKSFDDLNKSDILNTVGTYLKTTTDHSVFAVCILAHGNEDNTVNVIDGKFKVYDIKDEMMKCKELYGKPKILIVESCRGKNTIMTVKHPNIKLERDSTVCVSNESNKTIGADFLLFWATVKNYISLRNKETGAIFIQALCQCLDEDDGKEDIKDIFIKVNKMVSSDPQMSQVKFTMTKKLYLPVNKNKK